MGFTSDSLIRMVGHNGAEIGFHTQELIEAMVKLGYAVTEIQRFPVAIHPDNFTNRNVEFDGGNDLRFAKRLQHQKGILTGINSTGAPHAVSWINNRILDPATGKSSILLLKDSLGYLEGIDQSNPYSPTTFLMITSIT